MDGIGGGGLWYERDRGRGLEDRVIVYTYCSHLNPRRVF